MPALQWASEGFSRALQGRKLIAGGNAPGKTQTFIADPEGIALPWVTGRQSMWYHQKSTLLGSDSGWVCFSGALPPAIECIPSGENGSVQRTSFSAACLAPPLQGQDYHFRVCFLFMQSSTTVHQPYIDVATGVKEDGVGKETGRVKLKRRIK
jgi:hypothetical protein